ncbi:hypothetical protein E0H93_36995 [Rhizobium leguminosarum bv. viciae]|uniref:hypothetical protein n=1 Tax=Rhizobium leguminosarum TaxID=384 RepID=UPI00103DE03A|nr:hypothetical protein [Rhizobium leguminosarum]TBY17677.1 hypothetical protein E0H55_37770 [Rhizobium leguminosarum bv. viciae]TCA92472.1 hypothetical protein E0H93_36995 [Rhizobium leguminosarum bv. viciae]
MKRPVGVHLLNAINGLDDGDAQRPAIRVEHDALFVKIAVSDDGLGTYEGDFSTCFRKRPALARALAVGFAGIAHGNQRKSVIKIEQRIKKFCDRFLDGIELSFSKSITSVSEVDRKLTDQYLEWLEGKLKIAVNTSATVETLSETTVVQHYNTIKNLFEYLGTTEFKDDLNPRLSFVHNPVPGAHHSIEHRKPLSEQAFRLLRDACQTEIKNAVQMLELGRSLLSKSPPEIDYGSPSVTDFSSLRVCLYAYMHADRNNLWTSGSHLKKAMPGFWRASSGYHYERNFLRQHLHFTSFNIVAFVTLMQMDFLFDVDSHLGISWDEIGDSPFTDQRMRIAAPKGRGDVLQVKTVRKLDKYYFSIPNLLHFLNKYSDLTRPLVDVEFGNKVFIFVDSHGRAKGYPSQSDSGIFQRNLTAFAKYKGLEHFTLSQLRPTARTLVGSKIGVVKKLLHHRKIETTETSYDPPSARQTTHESISFELAVRERNITSQNKVETRGRGLSRIEKTAATPGFNCLDPLRSPILGQVEGKMCSAYGICPNCPLATIDRTSSRAAYRLQQLHERLRELQLSSNEQRWAKLWHPQLVALREWMTHFSEKALRDGKRPVRAVLRG